MTETKKSLLHIIPSNRWGGIQAYALDICRHYNARGWQVTALTRNAVGVDAPFAEAGIELVHAPLNGFLDISTAMILARRLRRMPQDGGVVHVHRYRDAFAVIIAKKIAKRPDIRVVSTRHAVRRGRDTFLFRKLYKLIDAHIFVSAMAYDAFRHAATRNIKLPPDSVYILRNSLNIPAGEPAPEPSRGPVTALYQGAIMKGKGLETLIDALTSLRNLKMRLRISGTGNPDYLDLLRRRAMSRGVMEMIDWNTKGSPSVEQCAEAHFSVLPSTEREALAMSALMAMAAGRPQAVTSNGAQSEYLEDGKTALLVKPADAALLAEAMRRLASDAPLRQEMGREAYTVYSRLLSWPHFIRSLNEIYDNKVKE